MAAPDPAVASRLAVSVATYSVELTSLERSPP